MSIMPRNFSNDNENIESINTGKNSFNEHDHVESYAAITKNSLLFTHDYLGTSNTEATNNELALNEFALIIHSATRSKVLHVGAPAKINAPNEKLSCVAVMEILSGRLSVNEYDNSHSLDNTLLERMNSDDFDIEADMYDNVEDDVSDSLSALNNTVFE